MAGPVPINDVFNEYGESDENGNAKVTLNVNGTDRKLKLSEIPRSSRCSHLQKPKEQKESKFFSRPEKYECQDGKCYRFVTGEQVTGKCFGKDRFGKRGIVRSGHLNF
ncbi:hypothetical protein P154DRAFT_528121 [Amniculicola lignicola CBS 123094]|uniref:Uncharacterized protein n=1 Tax=Amniculicola lignicola CBS 123094 TaxID=1392246 RepID=A0A6A5W181_9PLEO|nr:hypothetical protein P154DRAFT_528121 [Amniculicola lignicola CBS 123094]